MPESPPTSDRRDRPVIGLVGGIGAGKSTVARAFALLGCVVSDSDRDAKAALDEPDTRDRIVAALGQGLLDGDGRIDRARLATRIFGDAEARRTLESIVHPRVHARRAAAFAAAPASDPALVIDAPLLLEAGLDAACDAVVFVDCPREERLRRVREHRGWDEAELARREAAQLPLDAKRARADHVVVNDARAASSDPDARPGPAAGEDSEATDSPVQSSDESSVPRSAAVAVGGGDASSPAAPVAASVPGPVLDRVREVLGQVLATFAGTLEGTREATFEATPEVSTDADPGH